MCKIVIIGATGAVGQELLFLIQERQLPVTQIRIVASERSIGKKVFINQSPVFIESLTQAVFQDADVALFCAGGAISKTWVPVALEAGCRVIDGSSAFRMDSQVPLIIPEINGPCSDWNAPLIASPNCTATIALMALTPLHRLFGLKSFFASSYQAVSGSGLAAVEELKAQVAACGQSDRESRVYPYPIAFNVLPQVGACNDAGVAGEEEKFIEECQKVLGLPQLPISVTCVRVPVIRAHSIAIHAAFNTAIDLQGAREALAAFKGLILVDSPYEELYPTPLSMSRRTECAVGRLRLDPGQEHGLALWVVGDQLWKGAALNMVQILESVAERYIAA